MTVFQAFIDGGGVYGNALHYAMVVFFAGTSLILFVYLWTKGKLDMDEAPKFQMLEETDLSTHKEKSDG